jgi:hypothetical protein
VGFPSLDLSSDIILTGSQMDKDVLAQLEQASDDLGCLIQNVGSFVNWWGDMNMSLTNLEKILPQVRVDRTNPFRNETVAERWIAVHANYVWYQREVDITICLS